MFVCASSLACAVPREPTGWVSNEAPPPRRPTRAGPGRHDDGMHEQALEGGVGPLRDLGGGVKIPVLGLGVWQLPDGAATEQAVEWAFEAGYRHIDTATFYRNERGVGAALRRSGLGREQVFLTTKWLPVRRGPVAELQRSLERLDVAYVDLYLIHWPLPGRVASGWRALEQLRERGLARAIGVSNFSDRRLGRLLGSVREPPVVNQVHLSPLHFTPQLLAYCAAHGIVVEAYSPLERGRAPRDPLISALAERHARTPAQVALRWAVQHDLVVIPKSGRRQRIQENAAIFDFALSDEEMHQLDELGSS